MPQLAQRLQFVVAADSDQDIVIVRKALKHCGDDRHWARLKVVESDRVAEAEICVEELIEELTNYIADS